MKSLTPKEEEQLKTLEAKRKRIERENKTFLGECVSSVDEVMEHLLSKCPGDVEKAMTKRGYAVVKVGSDKAKDVRTRSDESDDSNTSRERDEDVRTKSGESDDSDGGFHFHF